MEDITERLPAEQAVRRHAEELEALRRVSLEITAHLDLDTVLHSIVSQAMQLLKGDIGSIFLFQADRDVLQLELVIGIDRPLVKKPVLQRGEGLAGKVWETGQPVIVDDYHRWEGRLGTYQEYSFAAVVGVPIYLGSPDTDGEFLGVVNVLADPPRTFSQADAELLTLFAAQAAIAIQNARLFEQARHEIAERRRAEQALRESEETARALLNTPTHVAALIDTKGFILDANEAMAQRFERQVHEFIGVNGWDLLPPHLAEKRKAFVDQVIQSGKPCRFEDEHGGTWFDNVFYPIHDAQGKVAKIAVLAGDITERKRAEEALRKAHDELEVRVQERTAELAKANEQLQAEIAVRARMAQALREHAEQLEALRQVGMELAAELDLESLLHSIVSRAIGLLGGSSGGLYLYRPELDVLYWAMAVGPNLIPIGTILHRGEGLSGKILESGEPLIVDNYEQWEGRAAIYDGLPIKSVLGVPVRWGPDGAGQEFLGVLNIVRPYTHRFTRADTELLSMFASQAAIAIHNARLYDTERQARRIAETLQAANLALTQSLDLDTVLETLLDHMARLIPYDSASVYLMETDSRMTIRAMRGYEQWTDPEQIRAITFDINTNPLTRELVTTRRSILIKDTREHPGWENRDGAEHIRSCLHVPLVAGGQVIGSYEVDKAEANFFTEEHLQLAEALAGQAAVAIQNARLYEQVHDSRKQLQHLARQIVTAGEEERRRLSRELHDEAGQDLTALKISLELIQEELPAELESIRQRITEAAAWTTAIMEKIRLLAHDLRPPALDAVGLNATLEDHCRRFAQRMHLPVKYRGQEVPKGLPAAVTISLYRVLQEALTNVARHARAHQAWVTLNCNADTICLSVEDDGQGFDKQAVMSDQSRSSGLGLRGIQERLSSLGGQLEIDTQPGQGTRLVAHVPWRGTA